jgi:plastocyanin
MRPARLLPIALLLLAAGVATACAGDPPGWTYAPAPPITPPPSVEPSASAAPSASAGPSAAPSASAPASAGPSASAAPSGELTVIDVEALNILFTQTELTAPADQAFQIAFANNDPGIPHNVAINDAAGTQVFNGETFNGVETRTYDVPALAAGAYQFICIVHPTTMVGTLTVGG